METGTVNIRGKEYKTVALRAAEFREKHAIEDGWAIVTHIQQCDAEQVICRAEIISPDQKIVAVGHAQEVWQGQINKTSALENCETSAIGRALAAAGWAGSEFASADEVSRAIQQQRSGHTNQPPKKPPPPANPDDVGVRDSSNGDPFIRARDAIHAAKDPGRLATLVAAVDSRHREGKLDRSQCQQLLDLSLTKAAGMESRFSKQAPELQHDIRKHLERISTEEQAEERF